MQRKVAVVTGAGSGIGLQIADALLDAGYHVGLVGRTAERLQQAAAGRSEALVLPGDVASPADTEHIFAEAVGTWGRLDLLVNNAGTFGPSGLIDEISDDDWRRTVDTNLTGSFLCAQQAFRIMRRQQPRGGRIINNGSISAHAPRPGSVAYTATKHAITGLTKSLALDGRAYDIACGQIDIGNALTDMTSGISQGARQADGRVVPEATFDARHVAEAVVHLASLPLDVNVPFMTIMATGMPYIGRG
ncbi:MAG: SDR family oxidoreductase [Actinomycetes bacterium]